MSRRVNDDFLVLERFLNDYNLSKYNSERNQIEKYKTMHKKLYAFLIFVAEFKRQHINEQSIPFLEETSSDLMLAMFCAIQGMYKPAKLQLRCGIENLIKSLVMIQTPDIITKKSVYEIFDQAKIDKHFSTTMGNRIIQDIHQDYGTLCQTVHGDPAVMNPLSALSLLPEYNVDLLNEFVHIYIRLIENYLAVLYLNYPEVLGKMHPDNNKDILDCMSKRTKADVVHQLYS